MRETENPFNLSSNTLGIILIVLGVAILSTMDATVKLILESGISVMQMLAMRSWLVLPLLVIWMLFNGGFSQLKTHKPGLHFLRVFFGFGAPFFFFNALNILSLPEATVIFFSSTFIMTALSVPILKEKVGIHRWSSIIVGFIGIIIATNPNGDMLNLGAIYALCAAISYSLMILITRLIGNTEGTLKMLFYFHAWLGLVSTLVVLIGINDEQLKPILFEFSSNGWGAIMVITVLVIAGHYCMMRAFSIAPVGLIAPFDYTALLWSTFLGFVIWNHIPGISFWIGSLVVVSSGIYLVMREIKIKKLQNAKASIISGAGPIDAPVPPSISSEHD